MDTLGFFDAILPSEGLTVIAELKGKGKWKHHFFPTHEEAAAFALQLDADGKTVYHACATYKTDKNRKAENAGWMKSFWVDADVDPSNPNKYASAKDALLDITRVCKTLKLPLPLLVSSGMGIHAYWILNDYIDAATWVDISVRFKAALTAIGFKQDQTRTADAASVLRPVGSTWRKNGARTVRVLGEGSAISVGEFVSALPAQEVAAHTPVLESANGISNDDLTGGIEYPPSSSDRIIQFCPTLAHIAAARGDVEEPLWRAMLGVIKYTVEGEARCHEWSKGYAGYSEAETQGKIDRWEKGPTTCAHFRGTTGNKCDGCPRTVTSPIALGYTTEVTPKVEQQEEDPYPPFWPKSHSYWNGRALCAARKGDDGVIKWVPFCETLIYPTHLVRDEENNTFANVKLYYAGGSQNEFLMPTGVLGSNINLKTALAEKAVLVFGKQGGDMISEHMRLYIHNLIVNRAVYETYNKLGWADNGKSFIIGSRRFRESGVDEIIPGSKVKGAKWGVDWGCEGSFDEWVRLVDLVYNRPGAEAYQFAIGLALSAPITALVALPHWHGIPYAITGETGQGKTTAALVGTSIYGHPEKLLVRGNDQSATFNWLTALMGIGRHLPLLFDEISDRDAAEYASFMYSLSQGEPKGRLKSNGDFHTTGFRWDTPTIITANKNLNHQLSQLVDKSVAEATQIRMYEATVAPDLTTRVWPDVNVVDLIEHQLLSKNYGVVAPVWIPHLMKQKDMITRQMLKMRTNFDPSNPDESRERYFRDLKSQVLVALAHAQALGIVKFDIPKLARWFDHNAVSLRTQRTTGRTSTEDYIQDFIASLHRRTITTKKFGDSRSGSPERPLDEPYGIPVARVALEDKVFLVQRKALADWCKENGQQLNVILEHMEKQGMLKATMRERIGRGSTIASSPATVLQLDYGYMVSQTPVDAPTDAPAQPETKA